MKKLLIALCLLIAMSSVPAFAHVPEHNAPYGMVKHHKHVKLSNRIKYLKQQHQNRIFQNFLKWDKRYKGRWSESFAPKGGYGLIKGVI